MTVWLTLDSFRQLCFELASHAGWITQEPIPNFDTRFVGRLEGCLEAPLQTFSGQLLYPNLVDQAAILFYLLNKNHPFANGNKRLALTGLLVFLFLNGKWLAAGQDELYDFAIGVATSDARAMDRVLDQVKEFISSHLVETLTAADQIKPALNGTAQG